MQSTSPNTLYLFRRLGIILNEKYMILLNCCDKQYTIHAIYNIQSVCRIYKTRTEDPVKPFQPSFVRYFSLKKAVNTKPTT